MGKRALAALLIGIYFFRLTRGSLHAWFSPDDVMNLYRSWSFPLSRLLRANLLFFEASPFYRPMGSAWYRAIFHFAGFHAQPFHVAHLTVLAANVFATYAVAQRLSGSREIGALAALIGCYHPAFAPLYFDTGYTYDVLCYFFYFAAFLLYLKSRASGRPPGPWTMAAIIGIYICALNSKEMAITLPLFLAAYEWLYHRHGSRSWRGVLATSAVTLVFVIGRAAGPESLLSNPAYRPVFSWQRFVETSGRFMDGLWLRTGWFQPLALLLVWSALLAIAWLAKSKPLRFAWLFLMLSVAPIAVLPPRGAPQYYIPLFGWALFAATALVQASAWIFKARIRAPLLFAAVMLLLYPYYKALGWSGVTSVTVEAPLVRQIASQLHELVPRAPAAARMFFLNDPYKPRWENFMCIVRLSYADNSIVVDRLKQMDRRPGEDELAAYDYIFDYQDGHFIEITSLPKPEWHAALLEAYHADWSNVLQNHPARAGEVLIAKATGLGPTSPAVASGQPFPRKPLARALARIEVKVCGRPTEVVNQLGWPDSVQQYRLDFRVPRETPPGMASVEVAVKSTPGIPARIPVR